MDVSVQSSSLFFSSSLFAVGAVTKHCSFILEGIATVLIAFSAFFVLYDFPDTASFLTIEERAYVVHKLKYQGSKGSGQMVAETEGFHWKDVKAALTDWQILVALWVCLPSLSSRKRKLTYNFPDVLGNRLPTLWDFALSTHHHQ